MTPAEIAELVKALGSAGPATAIAIASQSENAGKVLDALKPLTEQLAELGADGVKIVRNLVQVLGSFSERALQMVKFSNGQVPPERRIQPAPSVTIPILESVRHLEDGNPLREFYQNLLTSAMDRDKVHAAHPAFPEVIKQLSADEALILYCTSKGDVSAQTETNEFDPVSKTRSRDITLVISAPLVFRVNSAMYLNHLCALNLLLPVDRSGFGSTTGMRHFFGFTEFGKLFAEACIPKQWDIPGMKE